MTIGIIVGPAHFSNLEVIPSAPQELDGDRSRISSATFHTSGSLTVKFMVLIGACLSHRAINLEVNNSAAVFGSLSDKIGDQSAVDFTSHQHRISFG